MQRLEVSGVVRLIYRSLGVKGFMFPTFLALSRITKFSNNQKMHFNFMVYFDL